MSVTAIISFSLTLAGFVGGVLVKICSMSMQMGKILKQLETNEERDAEERKKNGEKFNELYNDRNRHETSIARLDTTMANINSKLDKIDNKLDRLIENNN